jgi:hypothetical protein
MKFTHQEIEAIANYWHALIIKHINDDIDNKRIDKFYMLLKDLLELATYHDENELKICIGVRNFLPQKSLLSVIFENAKVKAGLYMCAFPYGAEMKISSQNIIVKDGFYGAPYQYALPIVNTSVVLSSNHEGECLYADTVESGLDDYHATASHSSTDETYCLNNAPISEMPNLFQVMQPQQSKYQMADNHSSSDRAKRKQCSDEPPGYFHKKQMLKNCFVFKSTQKKTSVKSENDSHVPLPQGSIRCSV